MTRHRCFQKLAKQPEVLISPLKQRYYLITYHMKSEYANVLS